MRISLFAAAALCILLVAVVFAPALGEARWLAELHDFAHGPIFGVVALLLLGLLRRSGAIERRPPIVQYAAAWSVTVLLGLATELAQIPAGRDASWADLYHDAIGAAALLAMYAASDRGLARMPRGARAALFFAGVTLFGVLAAPLMTAAVKYRERRDLFPVLADFRRSVDPYFIWPHDVVLELAPLPPALRQRPGEAAAHVRFLAGEYPGLELFEPAADWRGFSSLAIDVSNPSAEPLSLVLRVHDERHDNTFPDRYNQAFTLAPQERRVVRFALRDIERAPRGRRMDLQRVTGVILFRANDSAAEMFVSRLWLE